jgi:hypothetical protein
METVPFGLRSEYRHLIGNALFYLHTVEPLKQRYGAGMGDVRPGNNMREDVRACCILSVVSDALRVTVDKCNKFSMRLCCIKRQVWQVCR